ISPQAPPEALHDERPPDGADRATAPATLVPGPPPYSPAPRYAPGQWLPWSLLVAGAGFATLGGILAWSVSWDDDCRPRCSPSMVEGLRDRANLGYVLAAIGGASVTASILVWSFRGRERQQSSIRAWVTPSPGGLAA